MKCYGCGMEKDPQVLEIYTQDEQTLCTNQPIEPLVVLEIYAATFGIFGSTESDWKVAVVCQTCLYRLRPNGHIGEGMWECISPKIHFADLPDPIYWHQRIGDKEVRRLDGNTTHYSDLVEVT